MTTLQIKYCDIPAYLHNGGFYRSLNSDDPEGIIEIPAGCFHQDGTDAATVKEFRELLSVMEFWMLDEIPVGILHFCNNNNVQEWEQSIADLPGTLRQTVQPLLLSVSNFDLLETIKTGRWELIIHVASQFGNQAYVTIAAAQCGHLHLLQHLHENRFIWNQKTCAAASEEGHLDCLQYAYENGCPWDVEVLERAARNGHLNCMQYAHQQGLEWNAAVCKEAALGEHLDCLQYAHENGCPWDNSTTSCAAREGHLHCMRYALEHGCPADEWACISACWYNHLECLRLLHLLGAEWNYKISYCATQNPSIDCLQYLHEHGCPWDGNTPDQAANLGHIEPLRYALEHGCSYDDSLVISTARGGNLNCLQHVVEDQLLNMDNEVFIIALLKGDLANLQYLLDQGCPFLDAAFGDYERWDNYNRVFREDSPEFVLCVEFAVERGWVPCSNFIRYIVTRHQPCRDWLIEKGFHAIKRRSKENIQSAKRKHDDM